MTRLCVYRCETFLRLVDSIDYLDYWFDGPDVATAYDDEIKKNLRPIVHSVAVRKDL